MAQSFYELLGVDRRVDVRAIRAAYQTRLADLVRRLRAVRKQGADASILEGQERALREAMDVLSDDHRRRRYDVFLRASGDTIPARAEELWEMARTSEPEPIAVAAVVALRALTDLPVGDPFPEQRATRDRQAPPAAVGPALPPVVMPLPAAPMDLTDPHFSELRRTEPGLSSAPLLRPVDIDLPLPIPVDVEDSDELELDWDIPPDPAPRAVVVPSRPTSLDPVDRLVDQFGNDGRFLHGVRELRGLSLQDVADRTRINQRYLEAIEKNAFDQLPAGTFVRGYIKQVALVLELSDRGVVDGYMALFNHHRG